MLKNRRAGLRRVLVLQGLPVLPVLRGGHHGRGLWRGFSDRILSGAGTVSIVK